MLASGLLCLLSLTAAAQGPLSPARPQEAKRVLDLGLWNARIQALYDLGEQGRDALPLLAYSSDDADWQVRLTAVHFLGKIGPEAAPALAAIIRVEPCPNVRVSALRWLSGMGRSVRPLFETLATPEDLAEMEREPDRYGTERMGKPMVIDAPDGMTAEFFNGGIDLRICASSEHSGRRGRRLESRSRDDSSVVVTPPVPVAKREAVARALPPAPETPRQKRLNRELDSLLAPGTQESLPAQPSLDALRRAADGPGGFAKTVRSSSAPPGIAGPRSTPEGMPDSPLLAQAPVHAPAPPRFEVPPAATPIAASAVRPARKPEEKMPDSPLLPAPIAPAQPQIGFEADAGTGKPALDPVPLLIAQLSDPEPRRRARAADELGKRGEAAEPAVPALRRALGDRDRRVRASAVLALGGVARTPPVQEDLRRALRDKDEDVRFSAAIALERSASKGLQRPRD